MKLSFGWYFVRNCWFSLFRLDLGLYLISGLSQCISNCCGFSRKIVQSVSFTCNLFQNIEKIGKLVNIVIFIRFFIHFQSVLGHS